MENILKMCQLSAKHNNLSYLQPSDRIHVGQGTVPRHVGWESRGEVYGRCAAADPTSDLERVFLSHHTVPSKFSIEISGSQRKKEAFKMLHRVRYKGISWKHLG